MKATYPFLLISAVLAAASLTGCSRSEGSPGATITSPAQPAARTIMLTSNDTMKFNVTEIYAKPGETISVTLTNQGAIPKTAMAHNWVLFTPDTDLMAVATNGFSAAATNYVPAAFSANVLASTKLLGPKESDTTTFTAPSKPGRYPFVCTFPGHMQVGMKGELVVE